MPIPAVRAVVPALRLGRHDTGDRRRAADTLTTATRVACRARVVVVARVGVIRVRAAAGGVAAVGGAYVVVVAVEWWATDACAAAAGVGRRAGVVVAARGVVVDVR